MRCDKCSKLIEDSNYCYMGGPRFNITKQIDWASQPVFLCPKCSLAFNDWLYKKTPDIDVSIPSCYYDEDENNI